VFMLVAGMFHKLPCTVLLFTLNMES